MATENAVDDFKVIANANHNKITNKMENVSWKTQFNKKKQSSKDLCCILYLSNVVKCDHSCMVNMKFRNTETLENEIKQIHASYTGPRLSYDMLYEK